MRAIIIATGGTDDNGSNIERWPAPLVPVLDRPFIQHVVEYLAENGVREMEFILCHHAGDIEDLLGDGTRWGCTFRFHLARDPERPYVRLKAIPFPDPDGTILIAHGNRLPRVNIADCRPKGGNVVPITHAQIPRQGQETNTEAAWTGWSWVPVSMLQELGPDTTEEQFGKMLVSRALSQKATPPVRTDLCLSSESYSAYLSSVKSILAKRFPGLIFGGNEVEDGIWISRNVGIHPTASIVPPVYIAEDCSVGVGVTLGPNVAVGRKCMIEKHSILQNSVVLPRSYVGQGLELDEVIIDKNRLINARVGVNIPVADFLLASLAEREVRRTIATVLSRVTAIVLLLVLWPVLLLTMLVVKLTRRGPLLHSRDVIRLPSPPDRFQWRTFKQLGFCPFPDVIPGVPPPSTHRCKAFFLSILPGLWHVAKGQLRFVGVMPRTIAEVEALSHDWRELYLRSKAGLITEADVLYGRHPTPDQLYSAEVMYAVTSGLRHDLWLLIRYFLRIGSRSSAGHEPVSYESVMSDDTRTDDGSRF